MAFDSILGNREGLWEPAELISSDERGHKVMNCGAGEAFDVGPDEIARSTYATDSDPESEV